MTIQVKKLRIKPTFKNPISQKIKEKQLKFQHDKLRSKNDRNPA